MKLEQLFEFKAVPAVGPDASRPTPVSNIAVPPPLPDELCKDRTYCERKKKNKKKKKSLSEMTINTGPLPQHVVDAYSNHLSQYGEKWADAAGGRTVIKVEHEGTDIYGLQDNEGNLISFVTFKPVTVSGTSFYELGTISTVKNTGGGFYPQLILLWTVKEHIGKPIIDYGAQSNKGKRFVQALAKTKRFDMFWYNIKTNEKHEYNPNQDEKESMYRGPSQTDWRIVIEHVLNPVFPRDALRNGFPFGIPFEL